MGRDVRHPVGAASEDEQAVAHVVLEGRQEGGALVHAVAEGEDSSHWCTTSTCVEGRVEGGWWPGVITCAPRPSRASSGTSPARTKETADAGRSDNGEDAARTEQDECRADLRVSSEVGLAVILSG